MDLSRKAILGTLLQRLRIEVHFSSEQQVQYCCSSSFGEEIVDPNGLHGCLCGSVQRPAPGEPVPIGDLHTSCVTARYVLPGRMSSPSFRRYWRKPVSGLRSFAKLSSPESDCFRQRHSSKVGKLLPGPKASSILAANRRSLCRGSEAHGLPSVSV